MSLLQALGAIVEAEGQPQSVIDVISQAAEKHDETKFALYAARCRSRSAFFRILREFKLSEVVALPAMSGPSELMILSYENIPGGATSFCAHFCPDLVETMTPLVEDYFDKARKVKEANLSMKKSSTQNWVRHTGSCPGLVTAFLIDRLAERSEEVSQPPKKKQRADSFGLLDIIVHDVGPRILEYLENNDLFNLSVVMGGRRNSLVLPLHYCFMDSPLCLVGHERGVLMPKVYSCGPKVAPRTFGWSLQFQKVGSSEILISVPKGHLGPNGLSYCSPLYFLKTKLSFANLWNLSIEEKSLNLEILETMGQMMRQPLESLVVYHVLSPMLLSCLLGWKHLPKSLDITIDPIENEHIVFPSQIRKLDIVIISQEMESNFTIDVGCKTLVTTFVPRFVRPQPSVTTFRALGTGGRLHFVDLSLAISNLPNLENLLCRNQSMNTASFLVIPSSVRSLVLCNSVVPSDLTESAFKPGFKSFTVDACWSDSDFDKSLFAKKLFSSGVALIRGWFTREEAQIFINQSSEDLQLVKRSRGSLPYIFNRGSGMTIAKALEL